MNEPLSSPNACRSGPASHPRSQVTALDPRPHIPPPLDTVRLVSTPEGCELKLRLAGPTARVRAWLIDFILRLIVFLGLLVFLQYSGFLAYSLAGFLFFLLEWLYPIVFEVYGRGASPGKKLSRLTVLHDDGTPVGWGASFVRNTLRAVDFLPFGYACGLLSLWLNPEGKRLGDLLAGTVVVYRDAARAPEICDGELATENPPFPLTLAEQQALIEYRQRAGKLSAARADELAALAVPLTHSLPSEAAKARLFRIANGLLGQRREDGKLPGNSAFAKKIVASADQARRE